MSERYASGGVVRAGDGGVPVLGYKPCDTCGYQLVKITPILADAAPQWEHMVPASQVHPAAEVLAEMVRAHSGDPATSTA